MADNTTLTAELSQRIILPLTADNIDAVGDRTARATIATLQTSVAQLLGRIQVLEGSFRTVYFAAAAYSVPEGNSGTTLLTATMKRSGDLSQPLAVTTKFIQGTLTASDFVSGSLPGDLVFNFPAGSDTAQASDQIKGDTDVEPTETLTRIIVPPQGYLFGANASYTGNVLNDDTVTAPVTGDMTALRVRDATQMDPDTGSPAIGIDGNGWVAEVTIKGLTAPAPDIASDAFFDCTKLELLVSDPGFRVVNGAITTATVYRKVLGRAVLRKQYKTSRDDINARFIMQSGSDFVVYVALGEQLYTGTTIVSAKIAAGFYVNGSTASNASSAGSLTNSSTYAYRKPTAAFLNAQHTRATGDLPVEMIAFHRHAMGGRQVAGAKFQARDTTGNVTAEQTVSTTALSSLVTATSLRPEVYKATFPLAALNQGELCYGTAKVYPHIGDASAVYDLSVDGTNTGLTRVPDTSPHTRLRFLNDKAGTYAGVALCDLNAVYTPIASSFSSSTAKDAFDGNYTSGFGYQGVNGEANTWVGQTFPKPVNVGAFRIWANGADPKRTFPKPALDYSMDGTTWVQVGATQTAATWTTAYSQMQEFVPGGNGPAGGAPYWRVRNEGSNPNSAFTGCQEIEFATAAGAPNIANGAAMPTLAEARKYPITLVASAFKAIRSFNALKGHDDYAGRIYLANGVADTIAEYGAATAIPEPSVTGLTWCDLMPDPAAAGQVKWTGKAVNVATPSMIHALGLTLKHTTVANSPFFFDANQPANAGALWLDSCVYEPRTTGEGIASNSGIFGFHMHYRTNCSSLNGGNILTTNGAGTSVGGVQRGLALALGNAQPADTTPEPAQIFVANTGGIYQGGNELAMPSVTDGYFLAYNNLSYGTGTALYLRGPTRPLVIAQNVLEFKGKDNGVIAFNRAAEGANSNIFELLDMHNTQIGNRGSRMYCEVPADRGIKKEGVSIGNVEMQWNIKTDSFDASSNGGTAGQPGNTGNWPYYHQVGLRSNVALTGALPMGTLGDSSYLGKAWETVYSSFLISKDIPTIKALFVNYQAQENGAGAFPGGGDYHPASKTNALNNRMAAVWASYDAAFTDTINGSIFKYALDGALRRQDGTGGAGAYESL